jgi:hypothetical protein
MNLLVLFIRFLKKFGKSESKELKMGMKSEFIRLTTEETEI